MVMLICEPIICVCIYVYMCVCACYIYIMLFMLFLCLANRNTVSSYFIMLFTHFPICRLASPWLHSAMPQVPAHRSRSKCPTHSPLNAWELHRSRHRNPRTNTWEHSQVEIVTMLLHVAVWLPWFRRISHKEPQLFANYSSFGSLALGSNAVAN